MITMFGADWCIDCRRAKQYLDRNEVPYRYVDLAEEPDEIESVIRYNGGRRSIPVLVFPDGSHLTEPTDAELAEKLAT